MYSKTELQQLSDIKLLEVLCSEEQDDSIYRVFVSRFFPDVKNECERICKVRKIDQHIGNGIAHDAFERCRKYKSFRVDEITMPDNRKAILVYLFRICYRLFYDYHKKLKVQDVQHRTYFDDIFESISRTDVKALKKQKDLAVIIFKKLSKKEQIVVLKDIEYKRHHKYLPDDVLEALAEQLNVKKDTIRKIRARAIIKINQAINEINGQ